MWVGGQLCSWLEWGVSEGVGLGWEWVGGLWLGVRLWASEGVALGWQWVVGLW